MNPAEFRATCENIGLNVDTTASVLRVNDRTVRRWNNGAAPVSDRIAAALADVVARTDAVVESMTAPAREAGEVVTFANDSAFEAAHPDLAAAGFDARWHRAVALRIARAAGVPLVPSGSCAT